MREEKRFWPELFWYAGGLIPLTIVTVVGPRRRTRLCHRPSGFADRHLAVAAASAHPWRGPAWSTLGGLLRLALPLDCPCPASTPHAVNVRSGAVKIDRCLGRPREAGRYGRSERDRQCRWHYEKCGGQECDEKAAGHHFLPGRNEYQVPYHGCRLSRYIQNRPLPHSNSATSPQHRPVPASVTACRIPTCRWPGSSA
jgi:hypothetical protein